MCIIFSREYVRSEEVSCFWLGLVKVLVIYHFSINQSKYGEIGQSFALGNLYFQNLKPIQNKEDFKHCHKIIKST